MEKDISPFTPTYRKADNEIYLNEDRYNKPKEYFKEIIQILVEKNDEPINNFLDVGCATGELIWFARTQFPKAKFFGLDISSNFIKAAKVKLPDCEFIKGSVLKSEIFKAEEFDVITCAGTLSIFDDQEVPLQNLISWLKPGGNLIIQTLVNENTVDMKMRYRDVSNLIEPWESGWNVFSKKTFNSILSSIDPSIKYEWKHFKMPFALKKRDDPMRAWTINTEDDPFQLINGLGQLINSQFLYIQKPK